MPTYGALEAGGTKFLCSVGDDPLQPKVTRRFATSATNPMETIAQVVDYFEAQGPIEALGVASFGPLNLASGMITNTPKLAWQNFPLRSELERALHVPVVVDTDVNVAAIGELECGAGRGLLDFLYLTVGTGIGGGAIVNGRLVHGAMHPEMGHMGLRLGEAEVFDGVCPFHRGCFEGLASGPAMAKRWGQPAETLPSEHAAWELEAYYLAQACLNLACLFSPRAILLGGGVMEREGLHERVRQQAEAWNHGYLTLPAIQPPSLPYPALTGALVLAQKASD